MQNYRPLPRRYLAQKGRRRIVSQFTRREGFWVIGIVGALMIALLVLWLLGVIRLEEDDGPRPPKASTRADGFDPPRGTTRSLGAAPTGRVELSSDVYFMK